MASFKDNGGREWKLRLNLGLMEEVKRETAVDLGMVTQDAAWVVVLFSDPAKLVSILWVLCAAQAGELAPEKFGYLFDGEVLEAAGMALAEAIADFFPRSKIARALKEQLPAILAETDRRAVAKLAEIASTYCTSAGNSVELPASTPDLIPSAN